MKTFPENLLGYENFSRIFVGVWKLLGKVCWGTKTFSIFKKYTPPGYPELKKTSPLCELKWRHDIRFRWNFQEMSIYPIEWYPEGMKPFAYLQDIISGYSFFQFTGIAFHQQSVTWFFISKHGCWAPFPRTSYIDIEP
jgi:hypothetical protein